MADWDGLLHGLFWAVVGAILSGAYFYFKGELKDRPKHREKIARALASPVLLESYRERLGRALKWLDIWLGDLTNWRGALQGLGVCIAVSMAYAAISFVVGWMLGGPGTVGNTQLLPRLTRLAQLGWGAALLVVMVGVGSALIYGGRIDAWCEARLTRWLVHLGVKPGSRTTWLYRLGGAIVAPSLWLGAAFYIGVSGIISFALPFAVAGAIAGSLAGAVAGAVAFGVAVAGAVAIAVVGAGAEIGAVAVAVAGAGAGAFTGGGAGTGALGGAVIGAVAVAAAVGGTAFGGALTGHLANPFPIALLLFFVALPVVNALLDWPSWWISRALGKSLFGTLFPTLNGRAPARGRKTLVLVGHMAIDLVAAVALLFLLATALPFVIEVFNLTCQTAGLSRPLDLVDFLDRAVQRPWPDGIWVLIMLLSTLFPTLLHAIALTASPFMVWLSSDEGRRRIAAGLCANDPEAIHKAAWHQVVTLLIGITAPLTVAALFVFAIGQVWRPTGKLLLWAAKCGIALADRLVGT